ncbi:bifunctional lysylphosphatidylglycerol flippase/synthetase MprF [Mycobacterium aquaticum]|nr:phosphatidylglycerol lysyltransferase domain-containing protein [Mycobacterium aquaticum]
MLESDRARGLHPRVADASGAVDSGRNQFCRSMPALMVAGAVVVIFTARYGLAHASLEGASVETAAAAVAVTIVGHGLALGRPVTRLHGALAAAAVLLAILAGDHGEADVFAALVLAAGLLLMLPCRSRAEPEELPQVHRLVDRTHDDPLAPFAMAANKSYVFSADASAGLAYRALGGLAVVSGDPLGDARRYPEVVSRFAALCRSRGWRIVVLGASESRLPLWQESPGVCGLKAIPIGRDVVVDVATFSLSGRSKRNLRQAVKRTHNAGISTEVVPEQELSAELRAELDDVMQASGRAAAGERGFAMMLGDTLSGHYPDVWLIIARDRAGRAQAFHRYAGTGGGTDLSLELPWRRKGAGNGIDERLSVDMIEWARHAGVQRVSLAFAPFPELFSQDPNTGLLVRAAYLLAHTGDRLIKLESLYRYLRKFDALGERRYVLISLTQLLPALFVLLRLEFGHRPSRSR